MKNRKRETREDGAKKRTSAIPAEHLAHALIANALDGENRAVATLQHAAKQAEESIIEQVIGQPIYQEEERREYPCITHMQNAPHLCATLLAATTFSVLCRRRAFTCSPDEILAIQQFLLSERYQFDERWPFSKKQMQRTSEK